MNTNFKLTLTEVELKRVNSIFRDALLLACASTLKSYCKEADCYDCPLYDKNFHLCTLRDFVPCYWELPNSKQEDKE